MTEPIEVDEETTTRPNWMIRFWRGFVGTALMPVQTRLIGLVLAGAIVFWGGLTLWGRIEDANVAQRNEHDGVVAEKTYSEALIQWHRDGDIYAACLKGVVDQAESREKLRAIFFAFADLSDVLPGVSEAELYTTNRRSLVEDTFAPIDIAATQLAKCTPPGVEPVDPSPPS